MAKVPKFTPGFRISKFDMVILLSALISAFLVYKSSLIASFIIIFTVFHFFLFCNVFRLRRSLELIWAFSFCILSYGTIIHQILSWEITISISVFLTSCLILIETRTPSYHGIFWKKLNPGLIKWWEENNLKE